MKMLVYIMEYEKFKQGIVVVVVILKRIYFKIREFWLLCIEIYFCKVLKWLGGFCCKFIF